MRGYWFVCLLIASTAFAQAAPSKTPAAQAPVAQKGQAPAADEHEDEAKPAAPATSVPENAPVLTIKGICDDKAASTAGAECKTVLTRAQFEKLADALQPNMPPPVRRQLATAYPRMLAMSHEATKRGLDKDPHFMEMLRVARMQILSQELNRALQQQAADIPDKEIKDYYDKNTAGFEQATLQRIFIPKAKQLEPAKPDAKPEDTKTQQQAAEEAMTKEADALHTRAATGEDFEKLQKEAYEAAGMKGNPPSPNMGKMRRTNLPPSQAAVFDLKTGEVSAVINDPSGHYVYKMVSKEVMPLDQVKEEIHGNLQNQRLRDMMQGIQASVTPELNEAYFGNAPSGPPPVPGRPAPPTLKDSSQKPPTQPK
jgi:parvulin-like peptidyl-prolyl cis-trans isomerase-like protein